MTQEHVGYRAMSVAKRFSVGFPRTFILIWAKGLMSMENKSHLLRLVPGVKDFVSKFTTGEQDGRFGNDHPRLLTKFKVRWSGRAAELVLLEESHVYFPMQQTRFSERPK